MPNHLRELTIYIPKELYEKLDGLFDEGVKEQFIPAEAEHSDMYNAAFLMGIQQMALEIAHRKAMAQTIVIPGADIEARKKAIEFTSGEKERQRLDYNPGVSSDKPQIIQ